MTRIVYQQLLNDYTKTHERQTTMDFHHQLKGAILDAVDEAIPDNSCCSSSHFYAFSPVTSRQIPVELNRSAVARCPAD
jgi:hypothetical protein